MQKHALIGAAAVLFIGMIIWLLSANDRYDGWSEVVSKGNNCQATDCAALGIVEMPHGGPIAFTYQANLQDGIAEWSACLGHLLDCTESDDLASCVADPVCPKACSERLREKKGALASAENFLEAVKQTYLIEEAYCGVPND